MHWQHDGKYSVILGLYIWVLVVYMVVPAYIFEPPNLAGLGDVASTTANMAANPVSRALKLSFLAIGGLLVLWRSTLAKLVLKDMNPFFLGFLTLVPLSVLWSIDPGASIARFIGLLSLAVLAMGFCLVSWHRTRFQDVFRPVISLLLFGSLIFGILYPNLAIDTDEQAGWHGLTSQKNPFGMLSSFGLIFWAHGWISKDTPRWQAVLGCALAATCMLLSKSSTSLLASVFAIVFILLLLRAPRDLRRYMPYFVALFAGIVILYAIAVLKLVPGLDTVLLSPIAAMTGKDMTFSNRSEIWEIIKEHIELSPLIGSGFGAYWTAPVPSSPSFVFLGRMWFWPSQSHNGYLEVMNDLGAIGLICLTGYLIMFVRQGLQLLRLDRAQGALFLALFFQQAFINLSESAWLAANGGLPVIVMTFATCALARALCDQKLMLASNAAPARMPGAAMQAPAGTPPRRPPTLGGRTPGGRSPPSAPRPYRAGSRFRAR